MSCDGGSSCTRHWRRYGTHVRSPSWLREYKYRMTEKGGKRYGRIASDLIDDGIARAEGSRPYTNYSCTTQRVGMKGAGYGDGRGSRRSRLRLTQRRRQVGLEEHIQPRRTIAPHVVRWRAALASALIKPVTSSMCICPGTAVDLHNAIPLQ